MVDTNNSTLIQIQLQMDPSQAQSEKTSSVVKKNSNKRQDKYLINKEYGLQSSLNSAAKKKPDRLLTVQSKFYIKFLPFLPKFPFLVEPKTLNFEVLHHLITIFENFFQRI